MKEKKQKDNRVKIKLSVKFSIVISLLAILITCASIFIGTYDYQKSIVERYDDMVYKIGHSVCGVFTADEIKEYSGRLADFAAGKIDEDTLHDVTNNRRYNEIKNQIVTIRDSFNANDIFVCVVDEDMLTHYDEAARERGEWKPLTYIFDSYHVAEDELTIGDKSGVLPQFREAILAAYQNAAPRTEGHIISETKWGNNISAILPLVDDGKSIGLVGVEIPMENLKSDVITFVIWIAVVDVIILIVVLALSLFWSMKKLVNPIRLVAEEANSFVSQDAKVSDKLSKIKSRDEIQMLSESLLTMELSINDYIDNIQAMTAEKERIGAELDVAKSIQASMVPTNFDDYSDGCGFKVFASMTPAKEVGGDFYDFFMVDDTHVALVMADVSGKGVPAALFMARAKTAIKTRAALGGGPGDILSDVNELLCEGNEAELFVTVWLAIIDIKTGKGMAANAGHEHPGLRHADGEFELVKYRHSPAVATMEGMPFREHEFEIAPGDTIFVYTDGVTEATDKNNELFGEERLVESLNKDYDDLESLLKNIHNGIGDFVQDAPQFDDITMLAFHYEGV